MMRFQVFVTVLVGLILFVSCKKSIPTQSNRFENSRIEMEKDPCFGFCPVYFISITGRGKVIYEGRHNVKKIGKYEKQLDPKITSTLFNAFECSNFTKFKDEYTANVTDLPTTYLTFEHRNFKKKIRDYYGAPDELKKLEQMVEEVALSEEGWTKVE